MQDHNFHAVIEDACLRCHVAVETGHGREWSAGVQECRENKDFNESVTRTCKQLELVENGQPAESFYPPSAVESIHICGEYSFVEILFLSTEQVLRHAGALPHELGLPLASRLAEDGKTLLSGCYLRADDLPESVTWQTFNGFRRVRLFSNTHYQHSKKVLQPKDQIAPEQGAALVRLLDGRRAQKDQLRPCINKEDGPVLSELKSLMELKRKVEHMNTQRREAELELARRIQGSNPGEGLPEQAPIVDEIKKAALDKFSLSGADAANAPYNSTLRRQRRKTGGKAASEQPEAVSEASKAPTSKSGKASQSQAANEKPEDSEAQIRAALDHDKPMMKVALALKTLPECLPALDPRKCMSGVKLGNQCFAVAGRHHHVLHFLGFRVEGFKVVEVAITCGPIMLQAKRLLPSLKGMNEETMLQKRITLIEAIQELVQSKDLHKMEKKDRLRLYQLVASNDIPPSEQLKLSVVHLAAAEQARQMVNTKAVADLELYLGIIMPFPAEISDGWDFFSPTLGSVVMEAVGEAEEQDDSSGWGVLVKKEEATCAAAKAVVVQQTGDWQAGQGT